MFTKTHRQLTALAAALLVANPLCCCGGSDAAGRPDTASPEPGGCCQAPVSPAPGGHQPANKDAPCDCPTARGDLARDHASPKVPAQGADPSPPIPAGAIPGFLPGGTPRAGGHALCPTRGAPPPGPAAPSCPRLCVFRI